MRRGAVPRGFGPLSPASFADRGEGAPVSAQSSRTVTLSTGHEIRLPLRTEAAAAGAVFSADLAGVREALPSGLAPVRVAPDRAAVTLLSVDYRRIGDDAMAPYDEFGVLLPAVERSESPTEPTRSAPELRALSGAYGGYVWFLPVTTEPGRALGVEVWDYPKTVLDISIARRGDRTRTRVRGADGRLLTLDVADSPTVDFSTRSTSYTAGDRLRRQPLALRGAGGGWPLGGASLTLGDHPWADRLRSLDLGPRALFRFAFDGAFAIGAGEPA